ncbi:MAG: NeuD/PglB/VioB family sugar acetyltransferase [Anaerolineales bacterium]|nr:NeuD/PglB/VioB family sugar acetyltransferase [Chloroflexota bacterium]MBL6982244.1 NeuD/PglB/VioB family sugar acetyltransferase [Anaerolineales bacterium]
MKTVTIPLINPNEPEALLADLHVEDGQQVAADELICTLETTKSTAEVVAEIKGYIIGLRFNAGDTVRAGDILCYLADSADAEPPEVDAAPSDVSTQPDGEFATPPEGMRITQPALNLAREQGISLESLPIGPLITEKMVRSQIGSQPTSIIVPESEFDPMAIIIYGGGGHGKSLLDLVRSLGTYSVVGFLDDSVPAGEEIQGVPLLGTGELLSELYVKGVRQAINAVGGIGNVAVRVKVFNRIADAGFTCPAVVHPTAVIEPNAVLSPGVQVFPFAYVGSDVQVGFGSIVNTGAIVSHDCVLGDFVNISPGAILAGEVKVGDGALVGMGVTVNLQAEIGAGARVGNGATVKSDVPPNGVVRAGTVWPV